MVKRNQRFIIGTGVLGAGLIAAASIATMIGAGTSDAVIHDNYTHYNSDGELLRPTDYRSWVFVGSPVTPNDMNNGKAAFPEFHNVYIDPASYRHYIETGKWREGTILVKELTNIGTKQAVSGKGYFQGDFTGLEATVKSAEHFKDEPGNWAYFSFSNPDKGGNLKASAAAFPTGSCNSCHGAAAQDDFVFTKHYPVLRAAKNAKSTPENSASRKMMMHKP